MKKEKLNVWISTQLKEEVYKEAQSKGMNISDYVRHILRNTVEGRNVTLTISGKHLVSYFEKETDK